MLGNKKIMGNNIQYYMDLKGINRKDFAKALNVPYSSVTEWINGISYPRIDKIQMMADYFGIEKADLVENRRDSNIEEDQFARQLVSAYYSSSDETRQYIRFMLHLPDEPQEKYKTG